MIDHKFYYCIFYYYHLLFVIIIKLFWQKKFRFCVNNKFANDFFTSFWTLTFLMVIKVEVKYKVIFQSKYECHSSQIEVKHVLSTGIWFFWILPDILFFREKKLLELLLLRFVWKDIRVWCRNGSKVQMLQIYLLQNTFLALKNALAILRVKKQNFLSVPTILEHSYQVKNIL